MNTREAAAAVDAVVGVNVDYDVIVTASKVGTTPFGRPRFSVLSKVGGTGAELTVLAERLTLIEVAPASDPSGDPDGALIEFIVSPPRKEK